MLTWGGAGQHLSGMIVSQLKRVKGVSGQDESTHSHMHTPPRDIHTLHRHIPTHLAHTHLCCTDTPTSHTPLIDTLTPHSHTCLTHINNLHTSHLTDTHTYTPHKHLTATYTYTHPSQIYTPLRYIHYTSQPHTHTHTPLTDFLPQIGTKISATLLCVSKPVGTKSPHSIVETQIY